MKPKSWSDASGSEITLLAPWQADEPAVLRAGVTVFPLDERVARRSGTVGAELALTARLLDLLPTNPTAVVVIAADVTVEPLTGALIRLASSVLKMSTEDGAGPFTIGVASPGLVPHGTAGHLSMYNLHLDTMPEALVDSVAAARRCGVVTPHGSCVLIVQRFRPAEASAVVYASPAPGQPVHVTGRWGLTETNDADLPSDDFEVHLDAPANRNAVRETLRWKPTASLTADGGTETVRLPPCCGYQNSLSHGTVLRLAGMAKAAAVAAGQPLSLDIAVRGNDPVVLRCRPSLEK